MRVIVSLLVLLMFSLNSFALVVDSIVCGLGIKNRAIVSKSDEFKEGDRIYCLTTLKDIRDKTYIIHRWVLDDRHFDVRLSVRPSFRFRTWSYKTIYPSMRGVWKLEVIDNNGKLLKEKVFIVR
ncbi:DUF2914 domain-containing protein [Hippea sp. KM1]|uniref:DUF2914 domain-containing protein n=1 Tax=Hippea sp. KM1 TaxID=944481 RepID=UPI00046D0FB4|nr:DUF2914 domain-containing protein [Hippea sp. KM1]